MAKASAKASGAAEGVLQGVKEFVQGNRTFFACIVLVLVVALLFNLLAGIGFQDMSKDLQLKQEAQMKEALREHSEIVKRQQIALDAQEKAELESALKTFIATIAYDGTQFQTTYSEYGPENITAANLARKAAAAEKFALQISEFFSHWDGMVFYMQENLPEIERLSGKKQNSTEIAAEAEAQKNSFKQIALGVENELKAFADGNAERQAVIARAVQLLEGVQKP